MFPIMSFALRRINYTPIGLTKVTVKRKYNNLKFEDLYDLDSEVKQKICDKLFPVKTVNKDVYDRLLNQTFKVNGILSDRYKFLHPHHKLKPVVKRQPIHEEIHRQKSLLIPMTVHETDTGQQLTVNLRKRKTDKDTEEERMYKKRKYTEKSDSPEEEDDD